MAYLDAARRSTTSPTSRPAPAAGCSPRWSTCRSRSRCGASPGCPTAAPRPWTPSTNRPSETVRIGVMVGPERGRYATKIERMLADATWAEEAGLSSVWVPQIPDDFDALTTATLIGVNTTRIEIGTAVVPVQPRHPIALAHQALSTQAVCGGPPVARPRRVAPLGDRRDARACPTRSPAADAARLPRRARAGASPAPGWSTSRTTLFRVHNPMDVTDVTPTPVLLAALGPLMLQIAGERTDGTILWLADERAIGDHIAPDHHRRGRRRRPPAAAHRRRRPGLPVRRRRGRRGRGPRQPGAVRGRGLAELPEAPRPGRRPPGRRHPRRRQRGHRSRSASAPSPTPAPPTSRSASSPSAPTATTSSPPSRRTRATRLPRWHHLTAPPQTEISVLRRSMAC